MYTPIDIVASSLADGYSSIPEIPKDLEGKYLHIAYNNTTNGTAFNKMPETDLPIVVDSTSEILSRRFDFSKAGIVFAGVQKNMGLPGLTVVVIKKDLLNAVPHPATPSQLLFKDIAATNSSLCTINTTSLLSCKLTLEVIKENGGISAIEDLNRRKSQLIYDVIDNYDFYKGFADKDSRSIINVCFDVKNNLLNKFLKEAESEGLLYLNGYKTVGGVRACMYNSMPIDGAIALADFMKRFAESN
jgi:phosphoserine aminotransferase